jgi:hypothetical protein
MTSIKHITYPSWLERIVITFTFILGYHLLFRGQIFTKLKAGKQLADHTMI